MAVILVSFLVCAISYKTILEKRRKGGEADGRLGLYSRYLHPT